MEQLRLLTFGIPNLMVGGEVATGATTRRRRLALLALLAVARSRGLTRDKIQGYLWPEREIEKARRGLNQLLYMQRQSRGGLFLGVKTPRLNPAVITCDVWEFEDALDSGSYEVAARLYTGPFLDGFYVKGAAEFERWADDQRRRLADRCAAAIAALARAATGKGDYRLAIQWWGRAVELNPLDADSVIGLIEAAAAIGDRPAAVRNAQRYTDLLRSELALPPDPRVTRLIEQLRRS